MPVVCMRLQQVTVVAKSWSLINKVCKMKGSSTQFKYKTLDDVLTWRQSMDRSGISTTAGTANSQQVDGAFDLASKISYFDGDITILKVGAIVNAANKRLLGGGGVDGCIHRAAGSELLKECRSLGGCTTGDAKITKGYKLPCEYVIHTVGPMDGDSEKLKSCYKRSFDLVKQYKIRSVAFPCIATGVYGFPNEEAADIALTTTKNFVKENMDIIDRVIFCVFTETDKTIYKKLLPKYFP